MTCSNLSICVGPSLLWSSEPSYMLEQSYTKEVSATIQLLIQDYQQLFGRDIPPLFTSQTREQNRGLYTASRGTVPSVLTFTFYGLFSETTSSFYIIPTAPTTTFQIIPIVPNNNFYSKLQGYTAPILYSLPSEYTYSIPCKVNLLYVPLHFIVQYTYSISLLINLLYILLDFIVYLG